MDRKFNLENSGNTESIINIESLKFIDTLNVDIFLKNYKISNFFKGKFFIKRLIKKVFKYKLYKTINWNKNFWDKISVVQCKASIKTATNISEFSNIINKKFSTKRIKNILELKNMIESNNIKLDYPLFISGDSLNLLNAKVSKNNIYILDGSRRIIAYLLSGINEINVYLILEK